MFIGCRKWHNLIVEIKQLESTTGFVIYDLPEAETYVGPCRLGAKLAPGNAEMLVRHQTYVFALAEQRKSGATIGLKVNPDDTRAAVSALSEELAGEFESQVLLTSPGLRLNKESLDPVLRYDKRNPIVRENRDGVTFEDELLALGAVTSASFLANPNEKWSVAIEGFNQTSIAIAREIENQGGNVTRISTPKGCVTGNFDSATLADAWLEAGANCVEHLGDVGKAWEIWKSDVDAILVGSKPGAMSGEGAQGVQGIPVIATSAAAISWKALAILRKSNTPVAADFLTGIGPALAWWAPEETSQDELRSLTSNIVSELLEETASHSDGSFMAACYKAEAFINSWQEKRPFGRPLG